MSRFYARNGAGDLLARYSFIEPLLSGKRVLEVGAAAATAGSSALFLAERGAAMVVSLEADPAAIEEAVREAQHPFVQFKALALDALPERAFDLVIHADGAALAGDPDQVAALRRGEATIDEVIDDLLDHVVRRGGTGGDADVAGPDVGQPLVLLADNRADREAPALSGEHR